MQPVETLVRMYLNSVGRNCNFILGEVMDRDGLVPDADIRRLAEFGKEVARRWGKPLAETAGTGTTVDLKLPEGSRIASAVLMEDIARGERIQEYALAAQLPGGAWQELARGQAVGHKRIEQFAPVEATALRLRVDKSKAEPQVRKLAAYGGG